MPKLVASLMLAVPLGIGGGVSAHADEVIFSGVGPTTQGGSGP